MPPEKRDFFSQTRKHRMDRLLDITLISSETFEYASTSFVNVQSTSGARTTAREAKERERCKKEREGGGRKRKCAEGEARFFDRLALKKLSLPFVPCRSDYPRDLTRCSRESIR